MYYRVPRDEGHNPLFLLLRCKRGIVRETLLDDAQGAIISDARPFRSRSIQHNHTERN